MRYTCPFSARIHLGQGKKKFFFGTNGVQKKCCMPAWVLLRASAVYSYFTVCPDAHSSKSCMRCLPFFQGSTGWLPWKKRQRVTEILAFECWLLLLLPFILQLSWDKCKRVRRPPYLSITTWNVLASAPLLSEQRIALFSIKSCKANFMHAPQALPIQKGPPNAQL